MLNKLTLKQAIDKLEDKKTLLEDIWLDILNSIKDKNNKFNIILILTKNINLSLINPSKDYQLLLKITFALET